MPTRQTRSGDEGEKVITSHSNKQRYNKRMEQKIEIKNSKNQRKY